MAGLEALEEQVEDLQRRLNNINAVMQVQSQVLELDIARIADSLHDLISALRDNRVLPDQLIEGPIKEVKGVMNELVARWNARREFMAEALEGKK